MNLSSLLLAICTIGARALPIAQSKRGVSYTDPSLLRNFGGKFSQVSWCSNWGSLPQNLQQNLQYVPMLWGGSDYHTAMWHTNVEAVITHGKTTSLLAFSEPHNPLQSNMGPGDAAVVYARYMMPFKGRLALGGPAISNYHNGLQWLSEFLRECSNLGCVIDFIPFHWFGSSQDTAGFFSYIEEVRIAAGGRDLWLTEFHASGTDVERFEFWKIVLPWLDNQSYIVRYAWFGVFPGNLVTADGTLTELGVAYSFGAGI